MHKLELSQILVKDARLEVINLSDRNGAVTKLITATKEKQAEILKLKEIDQERLKMVVQL